MLLDEVRSRRPRRARTRRRRVRRRGRGRARALPRPPPRDRRSRRDPRRTAAASWCQRQRADRAHRQGARASRVDALLQHEIGTHVVTHVNGSHQPLRLLGAGLAGYDETQEGMAVFAEYLVGGLTARRLRQLAARVVAVHQMVEGGRSSTCTRDLVDSGVPPVEAFTITMRVFRSGGLTKDAVYLRGLRGRARLRGRRRPSRRAVAGQDAAGRRPARGGLRDRGVLDPAAGGATLPRPTRSPRNGSPASPRQRFAPRPDRRSRMRIGFVVNNVDTESPSTRRPAWRWLRPPRSRGVADGRRRLRSPRRRSIGADARAREGQELQVARDVSRRASRAATAGANGSRSTISMSLMMRNDPADDATSGPGPSRPASCSVS